MASPPSSSTNSTSAPSMPISALRSRSTRRPGCGTICAFSSCRRPSTAPRRAPAGRCAGGRKRGPRLSGRDPLSRARSEPADRGAGRRRVVTRALRAETGSILVFLPGQGEIRRVDALLRERIDDPAVDLAPLYGALDRREQDLAVQPAPAGPPQGRARDLHRRNLADDRRRAGGGRFGPCPHSGLRAGYRPHPARDRAGFAGGGRSAARPRGRTEPGICYRLWEEAATGRSKPFARPEILSADLAPLLLDCAAWGVTDPTRSSFLDPPPAPALKEARALAARARCPRRRGTHHRDGPAFARTASAAASCPHGGERGRDTGRRARRPTSRRFSSNVGLGGDAVDLTDRVERFRRDRVEAGRGHAPHGRGWARTGRSPTLRAPETLVAGRAADPRLPGPDRQGARQARRVSDGQRPRRQVEPHDRSRASLSSPWPRSPAAPPPPAFSPPRRSTLDEIEAGAGERHRAARRDRVRPAGEGACARARFAATAPCR